MRLALRFLCAFTFVVLGMPANAQAPTPAAAPPQALAAPAQAAAPGFAATNAGDGQWPMPGRDTGLTRYSGLDQINAQNVKDLQVAFTFSLGSQPRSGSAAARRRRYALRRLGLPEHPLRARSDEARRAAQVEVRSRSRRCRAGRRLLRRRQSRRGVRRRPPVLQHARRQHDLRRRRDGRQIWRTRMADINMGETITMAPLADQEQCHRRRLRR